jgi:hypothetical protein
MSTLRKMWNIAAALILALLTLVGVQSSYAQATLNRAPWSSIDYKWPSTIGTSLVLTAARPEVWHGSFGSRSALDLFYPSADPRMLAMAAGEITNMCLSSDSFNVDIRDANGVVVSYVHLDIRSLDSSQIYRGALVPQGQVLGEARKGDFNDGCGTAYQGDNSSHVHLILPIDEAHRPFVIETCSITYPQKFFVCDGQEQGPGSRLPPSTNVPFTGIDVVAPEVILTPDTPANAQGWYTSPPTVTPIATDNVGVASVSLEVYRDNGLIETRRNDAALVPITLSTDGLYRLVLTATDAAGLTARTEVSLNLDQTLPTLSLNTDPGANAAGWNNGSVLLSSTATDNLSGLNNATLTVISGTTTFYQGPLVLSGLLLSDEGSYIATLSATDLAGNAATAELTIRIDHTAPTITFDETADGYLVPSGHDGLTGAGIATIECNMYENVWAACSNLPAHTPTLAVRACDLADNCAETHVQLRGWKRDHWWVSGTPSKRIIDRMVMATEPSSIGVCPATAELPIIAGESYTFAATILSSTGDITPTVRLVWLDEQGRALTSTLIERTPGFTGTLNEVLITPARAVAVRPELRGNGIGQVWFDDVSLRDTSGFEHILNGSFDLPDNGQWRVCGRNGKTGLVFIETRPDGASAALHISARPTWTTGTALMVESRDASKTTAIQIREPHRFSVQAGKMYDLLVPVRAASISRGMRIELNFLDQNGNHVGGVESAFRYGSFEWNWMKLSAVAPESAVTAQARIVLKGRGTVWSETVVLLER